MKDRKFANDTFKPLQSGRPNVMERTSAAAREIIDDEAKARAEKTARLRAMRLKNDPSDITPEGGDETA